MSNNVYILFAAIYDKVVVAGVYEEPMDAEDHEDQLQEENQGNEEFDTWIEAHTLNKDNAIA